MENFRDFLGKDLDDCISQAVAYYGCDRENLEIELIQDAKSGIFGIVGARKAKIRARRAHVREKVASLLNGAAPLIGGRKENPGGAPDQRPRRSAPPQLAPSVGAQPAPDNSSADKQPKPAPKPAQERKHAKGAAQGRGERVSRGEKGSGERPANGAGAVGETVAGPKAKTPQGPLAGYGSGPHPGGEDRGEAAIFSGGSALEEPQGEEMDNGSWPTVPLTELDQELLHDKAVEIVSAILGPIAGCELAMTVDIGPRNARVHVHWDGDAGLLIGRDGQTLAAVQYLASRILSKAVKSVVHLQLDIGNYRTRQDDKVCDMAVSLAEKVAQCGRPMSTSALSAYHRRLVHICLQQREDVQTRSIGDGPLKRILISPRRPCQP